MEDPCFKRGVFHILLYNYLIIKCLYIYLWQIPLNIAILKYYINLCDCQFLILIHIREREIVENDY